MTSSGRGGWGVATTTSIGKDVLKERVSGVKDRLAFAVGTLFGIGWRKDPILERLLGRRRGRLFGRLREFERLFGIWRRSSVWFENPVDGAKDCLW